MIYDDFLGIEEKAISEDSCKEIISFFETHTNLQVEGVVSDSNTGGVRVDRKIKSSTDICRSFSQEGHPEKHILDAIFLSMPKYQEKYNSLNQIGQWTLCDNYNIRRYKPGQGYFREHCEMHGRGSSSDRLMAWMLYLNDVTDGGETYFRLQDKAVKAETGKFLVWPAYWTHPHNGIVSNTQMKYIATGWFVYV